MASVEEFTTAICSSIEALREAQAGVDGSRQQAEELTTGFQMLGVESYAVTAYGWQEDVQEARAMVEELIGRLEQLVTTAEGLRSQGTAARAPEVRPSPTPLDAAPTNLKEPVAKVGDPVTAPEPGPGSYQQELDDPDAEDRERNRAARFGRAFGRRAESLSDSFKEQSKAGSSMAKGYQPGPAGTIETVGTPEQPVITSTMGDSPAVTDVVGTMVIGTAACIHAATAFLGRWKRKDKT